VSDRGTTAAPERSPGCARDWLALGGWIALALGAGAIGGVASLNARDFYATLDQPAWAPPGWLFGPVWTALYVLMGVAAWLVWRERPAGAGVDTAARRDGLALFLIQLALNALWTWIFFAWRSGAWAFAEIVVLWLAIAGTAMLFARIAAAAAWLLAPYLAWVTYAAALTLALWRANGDKL
jgi:tryptophan-rich sensory protein